MEVLEREFILIPEGLRRPPEEIFSLRLKNKSELAREELDNMFI